MRFRFRSISLCLALLGPMATATAGILFDNGAPDLAEGRTSDFHAGDQIADDFILATDSDPLFGVRWFGTYFFNGTPTEPDDFVLRIFDDDGGSPSADLLLEWDLGDVGRTATGQQLFGFDVFGYSAAIGPVDLDPETRYWLSLVNDTSTDADDDWAWLTSVPDAGNAHERSADGTPWALDNAELAFQLTAIPEPGSLVLITIGLVASVTQIRRRIARCGRSPVGRRR